MDLDFGFDSSLTADPRPQLDRGPPPATTVPKSVRVRLPITPVRALPPDQVESVSPARVRETGDARPGESILAIDN